MGKRRNNSNYKWKKCKKPRENVWRPVEECPRESELFENYYRLQKIVPEEEWSDFIETLVISFSSGSFCRKPIYPLLSVLMKLIPIAISSRITSVPNTTLMALLSLKDVRFAVPILLNGVVTIVLGK